MKEEVIKKIELLFFDEKRSIREISSLVDISQKSIGKVLRANERYKSFKEDRKKANSLKRKEYKRNWDRFKRKSNRLENERLDMARVKRQHEIDVAVLSHEKYF